MRSPAASVRRPSLWLSACLLTIAAGTGCQVDVGGQTLPSPYYLSDDVQYFNPGPEMRLAQEAAKLKEAQREEQGEAPAAAE